VSTKTRKRKRVFTAKCHGCGMPLYDASEYHPYAACVMFEALRDGTSVRANLADVLADGASEERWLAERVRDFREPGT
jgi:hypothetical protein